MTIWRFATAVTQTIVMLCGLWACDTGPDEQAFDRIENDMSKAEVYEILGEPTETSSLQLGGLSGTSAVWEHDNIRITIQFVNDAVRVKQFTQSENRSVE